MPVTAVNRTEYGKHVRIAPISAAGSSRSERKLGRAGPGWAHFVFRAADPGHDRFDAEDRRSGTHFKPDPLAGGR